MKIRVCLDIHLLKVKDMQHKSSNHDKDYDLLLSYAKTIHNRLNKNYKLKPIWMGPLQGERSLLGDTVYMFFLKS